MVEFVFKICGATAIVWHGGRLAHWCLKDYDWGLGEFLPRKKSTRHLTVSVLLLIFSLFVVVAAIEAAFPFIFADFRSEAPNPASASAIIIFISAILASLGWIFSNYFQERNLAKQSALQFINQIYNDPNMEKHKRNVSTRFPFGVNVDEGDMIEMIEEYKSKESYHGESYPILYSIIYILNTYEQIAIGIKNDRLDDGVLREFLGPLFKAAAGNKFRHVIKYYREPDHAGKRSSSFAEIVWLMDFWYRQDIDA